MICLLNGVKPHRGVRMKILLIETSRLRMDEITKEGSYSLVEFFSKQAVVEYYDLVALI